MTTVEKESTQKTDVKKVDPVVHFEIPAEDRNRIAKFYTNAFGWQTQMLGEDMGNYVIATTTSDVDEKGRPAKVGMINGGFFTKEDRMPAQYPSVVISVDDIEISMDKIAKAGGKVIGEPMEIPGIGKQISFSDTEGNRLSILEPTMEMKAKAK
jgi:uncharacterized protein